jgi:antitoxin YefM
MYFLDILRATLTACTTLCTMFCMSNTIAISDARANLPDLVNKASNNLERFVITINGQPKAVLMSEEELESLEETAEILAIAGAKEAIERGVVQAKKGEMRPLEDILTDME